MNFKKKNAANAPAPNQAQQAAPINKYASQVA